MSVESIPVHGRYSFDLSDRVVLLTGASRGLGRALAHAFAHANADLVLTARSAMDLESVAQEVVDISGRRPVVAPGDQLLDEDVERVVDAGLEVFGRIDALVNNAGEPTDAPFLSLTSEEFLRVVDVNLLGPMRFIRAVAPGMLGQGRGRIVNIGSADSVVGAKNMAAYCAAKGGLANVTRALAAEWAQTGIRVNALCPGTVRSTQNAEFLDDPELLPKILRRTPIRRYAAAEEIAPLCLYLCADLSDFVTGSVYMIDGGRTAV
ncbi:SDR family oxidoreductase [Saccharomonospora sp. NPDC046836]|uniref:SDR family NAD(P)-dependent oxidoreductase n=1 Tax=Saccharomonospora sp. NPDC046836 TaxID=3156921 RepID=UPI0033CE8619